MRAFYFERISFYSLLLAVVGTACILYFNHRNGLLLHEGVRVDATVDEKPTEASCAMRSGCHKVYFLHYHFPTPAGNRAGRKDVGEFIYRATPIAGIIPVRYLPNDPEVNELDDGDITITDPRWFMVMYGAVFLLWLAFDRKAAKTYAYLLRHGRKTNATLLNPDPSPWFLRVTPRCYYEYSYSVEGIRYTARENNGYWWSYYRQNSLDVLYDPDDPQRSMIVR